MSDSVVSADQLALLRGVIASPDDDLPRLVYADWLEEHGDETQGRFIRDSVAGVDVSGVAEEHGRKWLADIGLDPAGEPTYVRGMPEKWRFPLHFHFFADIEAGLFQRVPVRAVRIGAEKDFGLVYDDVKKLAAMHELGRLHTLMLEGSHRAWANAHYDESAWKSFFESDHLRDLKRLALWRCLSEHDLIVATGSTGTLGVRRLSLANVDCNPTTLLAFLDSSLTHNVRRFYLNDFGYGRTSQEILRLNRTLRRRYGKYFRTDLYPSWVPPVE